ncbi:MAG: hypothetical protein ACLR0A_19530, partial [Faecalibacillus intestinalis]
ACFKIYTGVWALSRYTLYFQTYSMPLIPDRQCRRKNRGEVYEETKNPKILRYRSAGGSWCAGWYYVKISDYINVRN